MNLDVDPLSLPWPNKPDPGRGDIILSFNGRYVSFEYRLPEYPEDIERTIREIIQGDKKTTDRTVAGADHVMEVR